MNKIDSWFKTKGYIHIGLPIKKIDKNWVENYVKDDKQISNHAFTPFIRRINKKRKFRVRYVDVWSHTEMEYNIGI